MLHANQKYNNFKNLYFSLRPIKEYFQGLQENLKEKRDEILGFERLDEFYTLSFNFGKISRALYVNQNQHLFFDSMPTKGYF